MPAPVIEESPRGAMHNFLGSITSQLESEPKPVVGDTAALEKAGDPGAATGGPDKGGTGATDAKPVTDTKPKADAKPAEDEDDDFSKAQQPKSKPDWENFRKIARDKKAELRAKLTKEIKERDDRLAELTAKISSAKPSDEPSPELKAQLERYEAENKELNDTVMRIKVTEHSKFKAAFDKPIEAAIARAKRHVGPEKAEQIEKILKLTDPEFRQAKLDEFYADIDSEMVKGRLNVVLEDLDKIQVEREAAIEERKQHYATLEDRETAARAAQESKTKAVQEQAFKDTVNELTDPAKGFAVFQTRDGDDAWNEGVKKRLDSAKGLLTSNNLDPATVIKAAHYAVALPAVLASYRAEADSWKEKEATYEAQIAELSKAQPKGGTAKTDNGEARTEIKPGKKPFEYSRDFGKMMADKINAG